MIRAYAVMAAFIAMTGILIAVQWTIAKLGLPGRRPIFLFYYRLLRSLLRVRVRIVGAPAKGERTLIVSNHVSWVDIPVLGAVAPLIFVAKSQVRSWPMVGYAAALQGCVFVDRARRQKTGAVNAEIARRLAEGDAVVLFAEGTSGDGNRVLQFRSALVGAANDALDEAGPAEVLLQPMCISYTRIQGVPMGRQHRPLVAWYGDMDFMPHFKEYANRGAIDAVVSFGEPVRYDGADRKAVVRSLEATVRQLAAAALRGEPA
jgi:1-acyl-sn-glycerol-3-phosphate acyltransferase